MELAQENGALRLANEQDALEMVLDFDSFVIELDSACDLTLKFVRAFREGITGQEQLKWNFEKLLASAGISNGTN